MQSLHGVALAPLVERGLMSQDAASLTWTCPTCGEIPPLPWGKQDWFMRRLCYCQIRAEEERRCRALQQELATQLYHWLGASWPQEGLADKTFATFDQTQQPEAYDRALAFAAHPQGTLWLAGDYGLGKTHLLAAIANARSVGGKATLFASAVTLFDAIGERIGRKNGGLWTTQLSRRTPG